MSVTKKRAEDAIIIGDLARQYNISKRTLRLYHEMGLLEPHYVDEETGYRYYSPAQLPRLEMIIQMKNSGLSLQKIKQLMGMKDISLVEAMLSVQIEELDRKIAESKAYRDALYKQLDSCRNIRNPPLLNTVYVEYIPSRQALVYDIEPYDLRGSYDRSPWREALERVHSDLVRRGIPAALSRQVGGIVSQNELMAGRFTCDGCFILLKDQSEYGLPLTTLRSGLYACHCLKMAAMDNSSESQGIQHLLDYIGEHGYQITGSYLAQVIAEASVFNYNDSNILLKQQIPIRVF